VYERKGEGICKERERERKLGVWGKIRLRIKARRAKRCECGRIGSSENAGVGSLKGKV